MKRSFWDYIPAGIPCLLIFVALFGYIGYVMGVDNYESRLQLGFYSC